MTKKVLPFAAAIFLFFAGCVSNPFSGKSTMALVGNNQLFPSAFEQYEQFLDESKVITGTRDAAMVERVGDALKAAAEIWLASEGRSDYLDGYEWEYHLVESGEVNAWCMPGGKIVVYTGILPTTEDEEGLAVVLGHEVSHALLNHGQQRMSADVLSQLGATGVSAGTAAMGLSPETQALAMTAYGVGSQVGVTLPFSRGHESEADRYGLILMAIAGYNPDAAVPFWERMAALGGGGTPEFLSTHPSSTTRIKQLSGWTPEAKEKAAQFGVVF